MAIGVILCNSDDNAEKQRSYLRVLLESASMA